MKELDEIINECYSYLKIMQEKDAKGEEFDNKAIRKALIAMMAVCGFSLEMIRDLRKDKEKTHRFLPEKK